MFLFSSFYFFKLHWRDFSYLIQFSFYLLNTHSHSHDIFLCCCCFFNILLCVYFLYFFAWYCKNNKVKCNGKQSKRQKKKVFFFIIAFWNMFCSSTNNAQRQQQQQRLEAILLSSTVHVFELCTDVWFERATEHVCMYGLSQACHSWLLLRYCVLHLTYGVSPRDEHTHTYINFELFACTNCWLFTFYTNSRTHTNKHMDVGAHQYTYPNTCLVVCKL